MSNYTEYRIKVDFTIGSMIVDPEKIEKLIEEELSIMYSKLEYELNTDHVFQHSIEVKPT